MWRKSKFSELISGYERLDTQIDWYDSKSGAAQRMYKISKITIIVSAALIPTLAMAEWKYPVAVLGALIAVLEGLQHLNQWHHNWITYRATCEALRHEKFTYLEMANPYDIEDSSERRKYLVERVESLISTEHSKWIAVQEDTAKNNADEGSRSSRSPN